MELNKISSDNGNQIRIGIFFIEPMQLMQLDHIRISSPFDARGNWSVATGVAEAGRCGVRLNHFEASTTCTISPVSYRIALSTAGMTLPGDSATFKLSWCPLGTTRGSEGWVRTSPT